MLRAAISFYKEMWPVLLAAVYLLGVAAWYWSRRPPQAGDVIRASALSRCLRLGIILAIPLSLAEATYYLFWPGYIDHAEPYIVAQSWFFVHGAPLYEDPESALRSSFPYGPILYEITGFALWAIGPSISASKLAGALAFAFSCALLVATLRRKLASLSRALVYAAIPALAVLIVAPFGFSERADSFILLAVSSMLALASTRPSAAGALALGVLVGLLANLKLHAPLYAVPALGYWLGRSSYPMRHICLIGIAATVAFILPFLWGNISVSNLVYALRAQAHMGLSGVELGRDLAIGAAIVSPLIFAIVSSQFDWNRSLKWSLCGFFAQIIFIMILAAKPGAGEPHFLPEVANMTFLLAALSERERSVPSSAAGHRLGGVLAAAAVLLVMPQVISVQRWNAIRLSGYSVAQNQVVELERILRDNRGRSIAMGYGSTESYSLTFLAVLNAFHGTQPRLWAAALIDFKAAGDAVVTEPAYRDLAHCDPQGWVLPHGEPPFSLGSLGDDTPVLPERFRQTFQDHYQRQWTGTYFDLWTCSA